MFNLPGNVNAAPAGRNEFPHRYIEFLCATLVGYSDTIWRVADPKRMIDRIDSSPAEPH